MNIELVETSKFQELPTSKTERVLEKWSNNDGELQKESIRKAASDYARLEVNNRILKWIIATVVIFLFVLLGFMIASVVLGVHITKDIQVKNGQLVSTGNNQSVVKTSTLKYINKITLNSPASVIDSLNSITVNVNDGLYQGILQFEVVSYEFIPGKQLTFYGHTHQADVMPDGSVKLTNLVSKRDATSDASGSSVSGTSTSTGSSSSNIFTIRSCADFSSITTSGFYQLASSLSCNLQLPLLPGQVFNGNFDGRGNTLTFNSISNGPIALFDTVGSSGSVTGIEFEGSLSGVGRCGTIAVTALAGSYFSKVATRVSITCTSSNGGVSSVAGGLFAVVQPSTSVGSNVQIINSVSQVSINFNDATAVSGGFYGLSLSDSSITTFTKTATDPTFSTTGRTDIFGFIHNNYASECQRDAPNYCLVDVGKTNPDNYLCCLPIERTPNNPDRRNCDSLFCYAGRDTSSRNQAKRNEIIFNKKDTITSTAVHPYFEQEDTCN